MNRLSSFLVLIWVAVPFGSRADQTQSPSVSRSVPHRWALGLQVDPVQFPTGHFGIPFQPVGPRVGAALSLRYQRGEWWAWNLGLGIPHSSMGLAVWFGHEVFYRIWTNHPQSVALEVYEDASAQLGYAGTDYFARHGGTFVGTAYEMGGPIALAARLPIGVRASWLRNRFDTYLEGVSILALTPSIEPLFSMAVGARFHF